MSDAKWSFTRVGKFWQPHREPKADENTLLAVETLIIPFGNREDSVRNGLRTWREDSRRYGVGYVVTTASASIKKISEEEMEIGDMYGQFEDARLPVDEFEKMLESFADALAEYHAKK
ncbi:hypothetical protein GCM10010406_56050 [Streptomyces thermolineatus]|uniref:Uncharacterized protein n=1 Tax=Streptomyces thermolineatus TaxID=44033 RepID=A0ABN3N276_9ACTN